MKAKMYAVIIIVYIVVIGQYFRDKIFGQNFGLFTLVYFSILALLSILFFKNYKPANKKNFAIYITLYIVVSAILVLYFAFKG
jgi:drug/metabolite transporter (DMT)-like permease